jgi:hypothetical protein
MSVLTLRMTAGAAGVEEARRRGRKAVVVWMRPKRFVSTAERMEGRWGVRAVCCTDISLMPEYRKFIHGYLF